MNNDDTLRDDLTKMTWTGPQTIRMSEEVNAMLEELGQTWDEYMNRKMIKWPEIDESCGELHFVDVTEQVKQVLEMYDIPYEIKELDISSRKIPYMDGHPCTLDKSITALVEYIQTNLYLKRQHGLVVVGAMVVCIQCQDS